MIRTEHGVVCDGCGIACRAVSDRSGLRALTAALADGWAHEPARGARPPRDLCPACDDGSPSAWRSRHPNIPAGGTTLRVAKDLGRKAASGRGTRSRSGHQSSAQAEMKETSE